MLPVVPYELDEIKEELKIKAIEELGILDAQFEGSNVSQLINLLAYSTLINNTNLTFGLNEMFITQAIDRKNVIKHARQMGYINKRLTSFQYKIKIQAVREGLITLNKYSKFTSAGKDYVYLGDDITETFGTNFSVKELINEYNNEQTNLFSNLEKNDIVITEDGQACKVLEKLEIGYNSLLLENLSSDAIYETSTNYTQDVFVEETDENGNIFPLNSTGYRSFTKVGNVDTFIYDDISKIFRVQISIEDGMIFPIFTTVQYNTTVVSNKLETPTTNPIKFISELILSKVGEDTINVDVNSVELIEDSENFYNNILFPENSVNAEELHPLVDGINDGVNDAEKNLNINTFKPMIEDKFHSIEIDFGGRIKTLFAEDIIIDYVTSSITIPTMHTAQYNYEGSVIQNTGKIDINDDIYEVNMVILIDNSGNRFSHEYFSFSGSVVQLRDSDGNETNAYDTDYTVEIEYVRTEDLTKYPITINYDYLINLEGYDVNVTYSYDKGADGLLDRSFYFSDLRGESILDEDATNGWAGFKASDFDSETNVLYFDVSPIEGTTHFHNEYVKMVDENNILQDPLPLNLCMKTPFKKTRFFYAKYDSNIGGYIKNGNSCFASVKSLTRKNEIEIVVREGKLKRYNDIDENGLALYPELTIEINDDMAKSQYFTLFAPDVEEHGIELFVTRVMPDGTIEYDTQWFQRNFLLAEQTGQNITAKPKLEDYGLIIGQTNQSYEAAVAIWERERIQETFIALSNLEYEDYLNIYSSYAGTGTPLSTDMTIKINIMTSQGTKGFTNDIISPVSTDDFIGVYFITESLTPHIIQVEGADTETTDDIRFHAPQFSNTSNRAVTKSDYKTISEAQTFISEAQVWGGEEVPLTINSDGTFNDRIRGTIFFSVVPNSKPYIFKRIENKYLLDNVLEEELFFPTYLQITGKESYTELKNENKNNKNILFSVLEDYKIITLNFEYEKAIYLDISININVLKYKFGQTVLETNQDIFDEIKRFTLSEIETFESSFYLSSLIRHIDSIIGDSYGLDANTTFSVNLYDSFSEPERGTFINIDKKQIAFPDTYISDPVYKGINYPGYNDIWQFKMPISTEIKDLFSDDYIMPNGIIERGKLNIENITDITTNNFCFPGDSIFLSKDINTFKSFDKDLVFQTNGQNTVSEYIEISVIYKTGQEMVLDDGNNNYTVPSGTLFKVGSYIINKSNNIIIFTINTTGRFSINNPRIYINSETIDPDDASISENKYIEPIKLNDGLDLDGNTYPYIIEAPLPREFFMNVTRKLNIVPRNNNISVVRNVFPRLVEVNFSEN